MWPMCTWNSWKTNSTRHASLNIRLWEYWGYRSIVCNACGYLENIFFVDKIYCWFYLYTNLHTNARAYTCISTNSRERTEIHIFISVFNIVFYVHSFLFRKTFSQLFWIFTLFLHCFRSQKFVLTLRDVRMNNCVYCAIRQWKVARMHESCKCNVY